MTVLSSVVGTSGQRGLILLYLGAVIAANLGITAWGPVAAIPVAFVLIGVDLTARDFLHEAWGHGLALWLRMAGLIATGSLLSWLLNRDAGQIAVASCVAFGLAGLADAIMYSLLGGRTRLLKINGSNVVSAAVDSLVFPGVAFGFPLMWPVMAGQWVAKVMGGAVWGWVLCRPFWARGRCGTNI